MNKKKRGPNKLEHEAMGLVGFQKNQLDLGMQKVAI